MKKFCLHKWGHSQWKWGHSSGVSPFLLSLFVFATSSVTAQPVKLGLFGDMPYGEPPNLYASILKSVGESDVDLAGHVGDIKSGSSHCTNETFQARFKEFDELAKPLLYVFGDNEWSDCGRDVAGRFDPLERLSKLRQLFTATGQTLGRTKLALERQSADARFAQYPEQFRMVVKGHVIAGIHIVGETNNFGEASRGGNDDEARAREAAVTAWVEGLSAYARAKQAGGIVILGHANPRFEDENARGFRLVKRALRALAKDFKGPVVFVHGDTHKFRFDQPLRDVGMIVPNFYRLEVYGAPDMYWVQLVVDHENAASPVTVRPVVLPDNR
jgi:hypothetical protein